MSKLIKKVGLIVFIIICVISYYRLNGNQYLNLENLKLHHQELLTSYQQNPFSFSLIFFFIYIGLVALSFPGATVLSLAGGYIFGFFKGLLIINWASTIGASIAFLIARFFFKDYLQRKFHHTFLKINQGMDREGIQYLLTLRLIPIFPFFLINILMGLTNISLMRFFVVSLIGMLPGTAVYVWAGTSLQAVNSVSDIFSAKLITIFFLVGLIPVLQSKLLIYLKQRKHYLKFSKPKNFDYNLIVIGGGAAGLVNAYIAANLKAKVLLVEEDKMGGECLNYGCVPSKALISLSKTKKYSKTNFAELSSEIAKIIQSIAPHDSVSRYSELGVECVKGKANLISPYEIRIDGKTYSGRKVVIATGAKPFYPELNGLDKNKVFDYESIWKLEKLPEELVIIGGGAIGCELALAFSKLGSKVTIIEQNTVLVSEDRDIVSSILKGLSSNNIDIFEKSKIISINHAENKILFEIENKRTEVHFEELLMACGKEGNTNFISSNLNFDLDTKKFIIVNEHLETLKYRNIYACGDVNGLRQLTNAAAHQAWYTSVNALFGSWKKFSIEHDYIPHAVFIEPELARVGLNELDAKRKNIEYDLYHFDSSDLDRNLIERNKLGKIKVLTIKNSDQILGVTIVGEAASEIIAEFVLAMKYQLGLNKILATSHIYPSFSEQNKYVAGVWKKRSVPEYLYKILKKYHQIVR